MDAWMALGSFTSTNRKWNYGRLFTLLAALKLNLHVCDIFVLTKYNKHVCVCMCVCERDWACEVLAVKDS